MTKQKTLPEEKKKKKKRKRAKGLNLTLSQMLMKCYEDSKDNDFGFN